MEVVIGAVVMLVILAGIHRTPQEGGTLPKRRGMHKRGFLGATRKAGPKRTAAYWWFRESAKGAG